MKHTSITFVLFTNIMYKYYVKNFVSCAVAQTEGSAEKKSRRVLCESSRYKAHQDPGSWTNRSREVQFY